MFGRNLYDKYLIRFMRETFEMPVSQFVPSDQAAFVKTGMFRFKVIAKHLKRRIFFFLALQKFFQLTKAGALETKTRILWINLSAPSLGDSLMDLSGRVLLKGKTVDLFTSSKNILLYKTDHIFRNATSNVFTARSWHKTEPYDVILIDSYAPRALTKKLIVSMRCPVLGMYGFLNGFEIHRTYFSFRRLEFLLGQKGRFPVRPSLTLLSAETPSKISSNTLCFAIGGEWPFRTYEHWVEVIADFVEKYRVVLVGSSNGCSESAKIIQKFPEVKSYVGILSLRETSSIIGQSSLFVGADGGLWHVACGLNKPSVVLFADCSLFDQEGRRVVRSTIDMDCSTLYDSKQVSNIAPTRIVDSICQRLEKDLC